MAPPTSTADLYGTLQQYELMLVTAGRRLWRRMAPDNFDGSWSQIAPQMTAFTAGAQLAAAQAGSDYVPAVLEETGQPDEPEAHINPRAFSGVASDGRSLPGLLEGSVVAAKRAVTRGLDGGDALKLGEKWLEQALQTAVADAMRDATQAEIIARPKLSWVRMVNPPCCSRCAVLAGKVFNWNASFDRHPQCDCLAIPVTVANADTYLTNPTELAKRGLINDLSKNQLRRIADGANLPKVLNESRDRWRERMAADRAKQGPVDRLGRRRPSTWGGAKTVDQPPRTVHDFMAHLTNRVDVLNEMRAAGIAN